MLLDSLKWLNESRMLVDGETLTVFAPAYSDYFNSPVPENGALPKPQGNAPFLYIDVEGDFVARVKVTPKFSTTFDAGCLMAIKDENVWAKAAFEKSDFGTTAVVSVITNRISDDANGCNIDAPSVWLQLARVGDNVAIHYSLDGEKFDMVRLASLPFGPSVKVGVEAQCPAGDGGERVFCGLSIERRSLRDLRAGV